MDKPEWILTLIEIMQLQEFQEGDSESIGYERNISNYAQKKLLKYQLATVGNNLGGNLQIAVTTWLKSMIEQLEDKNV